MKLVIPHSDHNGYIHMHILINDIYAYMNHRLSVYRRKLEFDIAHSTTEARVKLQSGSELRKRTHYPTLTHHLALTGELYDVFGNSFRK